MSEAAAAAVGTPSPEPGCFGLFVIWPAAAASADVVLQDLADRFTVVQRVEVHWTDRLVQRNYERFYSDLEVAGFYHELNKGRGPFLAVAVRDPSPVVEDRPTSRGVRPVSANLVDAKQRYRDEMGGIAIHCGENEWESTRDLAMLLGLSPRQLAAIEPIDTSAPPSSIHRDITGAGGWASTAEMFQALNPVVPYVALDREGGEAPGHGDPLRIITSALHSTHTIIDGRPVDGRPRAVGGRFEVTIADHRQIVDLRPVDGGLIDPAWAQHCLDGRELDDDGVYRAPIDDDIAIQAHLAVSYRHRLTAADERRVRRLAQCVVPSPVVGDTPRRWTYEAGFDLVTDYLDRHGYRRSVPGDTTVIVDRPDDTSWRLTRRRLRVLGVRLRIRAAGHLAAVARRIRGVAVLRLPRLRSWWRRARGLS